MASPPLGGSRPVPGVFPPCAAHSLVAELPALLAQSRHRRQRTGLGRWGNALKDPFGTLNVLKGSFRALGTSRPRRDATDAVDLWRLCRIATVVEQLNWGIIGPGNIARAFAGQLRQSRTGRLVAVGSRVRERAAAFADEFGAARAYGAYQEVLDDSDVDAG